MMQLVWNLIRDALQPIKLRDLAEHFEDFVAAIFRMNGRAPGARQRKKMGLVEELVPP